MKSKFIKIILLSFFSLFAVANAEEVLRRGINFEPATLNPQASSGVSSGYILRELFEGLVAEGENGEPAPGVAKSWEVSSDGLIYTFHLRDSLWSNGTPVTANDFVYSWRREVNPKTESNCKFMFFPIKNAKAIASGEEPDFNKLGIKAIDTHTLEIELEHVTPYFIELMCDPIFYPIKEESIKKYGDAWSKPEHIISNGAFKLTEWIPKNKIILTKSKNYWDKSNVKLNQVIYYVIENSNNTLQQFEAGKLDWIESIPNGKLNDIKELLPNSLVTPPCLAVYYYNFNLDKPEIANNLELRKALSYAIDRDIIVNKIRGGGGISAYNLIMPGVLGTDPYVPDYAKLTQKQRNEQAKQYYNKAGYSQKQPLEIVLSFNTSDSNKQIATAIAAMWKQTLGVQTTFKDKEWPVYLPLVSEKNKPYDIYRAGYVGDYNDGNTFLGLFTSNSEMNYPHFVSEKYDNLLAQANNEQNQEKRMQLQKAAEKELIDSFAIAPIFFYTNLRLINPRLKGYSLNVKDISRSKYMYFSN